MDNISLIRDYIATFKRGSIFFIKDICVDLPSDIIRVSLSSLVEENFIFRLARAVYYYPSISDTYSAKIIFPSDDFIAYMISERYNNRIVPSGEYSSYSLGLSKFKINDLNYISDGASRRIVLYNGHIINFIHTSEARIFAFNSTKFQSLSLAIRYLGKEFSNTVNRRRIIKDILNDIPESDYTHDITLMPAWVREIIEDIKA